MLLAYVVCGDVTNASTVLCVVPDKPDQFSNLIPIPALRESDCAYLRVSAIEALLVRKDPDSSEAFILEPVPPSKLYITPDLHDKPGVAVRSLKIVQLSSDRYEVYFVQEVDSTGQWKEWSPLKLRTSASRAGR